MTDDKDKVWLITGCSTGFGRELAKLVLAQGFRLVATARDASSVRDIAQGDRALALPLDVTDPAEITAAVAAALDKFGRIDVLVNNAGYGYQSTDRRRRGGGDPRPVRRQRVRPVRAHARRAADHARAARRQHPQHHLGRGPRRLHGLGLLRGLEARGRRVFGRVARGSRAARHRRHLRRARPVPHRLGRPLAAPDAPSHQRLRRNGGPAARCDQDHQRHPARRPRARGASDDRARQRRRARRAISCSASSATTP